MKKILFILATLLSLSANSLLLNLKNVDITTLINTVAMANNKNFMIDPRVKGVVNVISNKDIAGEQLYQVFLTILKAHGYIVIEGENVSRIVPKNLTKSESAFVSSNATDAIITKILHLTSIEASKIVPIVRPLMSAYGLLSVYTPNNSLIIIDTGANVARLENIIAKLDKPIDDDFEFIKLENSSASQIATTVKPLFSKAGSLINITVDQHNNQLIVSGNKDKRLKVRLLVAELDKYKLDAGTTAVIYLKYASAKDILPILQGINQYNSTANKDTKVIKSNIQANEPTNSIIVTGDTATKQTIKNIIAKLDVRRAQVLIEAVIAEVSLDDAKELGIQWVANSSGGIGFTNLNGALTSLVGGVYTKKLSGISKGANFFAGRYDKNTNKGFGVLINALNSSGNTNILSTPSILTLDNHEAEISVGEEVPFITSKHNGDSQSNPFQSIERKDVGLKLIVKPQINDGSSIKLDIYQEMSSISKSASASDLITSKRTLKTSVMVEDGKMLVLGGLISDQEDDHIAKVPILGDIPLFGRLFTYKTKGKRKSNLMIFIRPTILKDQILSDAISMEKYNYIKAAQLLNNKDFVIKDQSNFFTNVRSSKTIIIKKTPVKKNTKGIHFINNNTTKPQLIIKQTTKKLITPTAVKKSIQVVPSQHSNDNLKTALYKQKYAPLTNSSYYLK